MESVIEDTFTITGRGLVITCNYQSFKDGEFTLEFPDGSSTKSPGYLETCCNRTTMMMGINFPRLNKADVPIGTKIRQ